MPKFLKRFFEKKEMIHDGGVHTKANFVDFFVILGCAIIIICLCILGFLAYANA